MQQSQTTLQIQTRGRGFVDLDAPVTQWLRSQPIQTGLLTVFIKHTSASLLIQENADPDVLDDLSRYFEHLVRDADPMFRHRAEGPDDMAAHVRSALTQTSLSIPVSGGRLTTGTWQGLYLMEHRHAPHRRSVVLHLIGE